MLEPVAGVVGSATRPISNAWRGIVDYGDVKDENDRLRDEVAQLRASAVDQANARDQLDMILAQQDIARPSGSERRKLARVVSGPASNFDNTDPHRQGRRRRHRAST